MKKDIHPPYHKAEAVCACGTKYQIGSTKKSLRVDICAACHPLFTGKQKLIDVEGRVERFKKKYTGKVQPTKEKKPKVRTKKKK